MYFYCFDELGNLYRGGEEIVSSEACTNQWKAGYKDKIYVYFADGGHRLLPKTEGKVYYRTFWLKEKDNKKAGEIAQKWVEHR